MKPLLLQILRRADRVVHGDHMGRDSPWDECYAVDGRLDRLAIGVDAGMAEGTKPLIRLAQDGRRETLKRALVGHIGQSANRALLRHGGP